MWIKKTEEELDLEKNKKLSFWDKLKQDKLSPIQLSITIFILFFLLIMSIELFIGVPLPKYPRGHGGFGERISFSEVPNRLDRYLFDALFIAIVIFICFYPWSKKNIDKKIGKTFVCDKCNSLKRNDGINTCDCRGTYQDLKIMKWIDDK